MSVSTTSSVNDVLPTWVPKLDVSGGNWAEFSLSFQTVVQGRGYWGHFDGSKPRPVMTGVPTTAQGSTTVPTLSPAPTTSTPVTSPPAQQGPQTQQQSQAA